MGDPQPEWELIRETGFVPVPRVVLKALVHEATRRRKLSIVAVGLAIVAESIGWANRDGEGRQLLAHVSLSRFEELTGLTRPTIVATLRDLEEMPMFRRVPSENRQWSGWQYGIDFEWLTREAEETGELSEFTTDTDQVVNSVDQGSIATLPPGSEESLPEVVNSVYPTKKVPKETPKEVDQRNGSLSDQISQNWSAILQELQAQTTAASFSSYLKGLAPLPSKNGEILLQARNRYAASWIALRLDRVVLRALQAVEPTVAASQVRITAPDGEIFAIGEAVNPVGGQDSQHEREAYFGIPTERAPAGNPMEQPSGA